MLTVPSFAVALELVLIIIYIHNDNKHYLYSTLHGKHNAKDACEGQKTLKNQKQSNKDGRNRNKKSVNKKK